MVKNFGKGRVEAGKLLKLGHIFIYIAHTKGELAHGIDMLKKASPDKFIGLDLEGIGNNASPTLEIV